MSPILVALVPDILLLMTGGFLRRKIAREVWQSVDSLNFLVLFPALIFVSAVRQPPSLADLSIMGLGVWLGMLFAGALGWGVRRLGPDRFVDFAGMWQTTWRFNTAIAIVAAQVLPEQARGLMSVAIGLAVPFANILAISALAHEKGGSRGQLVKQVLRNPFLLASLGGVAFSLIPDMLPGALLAALGKLASAAVPLALLSIGASVNWLALVRMDRFEACLNLIKLVLLPGATWMVTGLIGLAPGPAMVLTIFAALPTASAAHVLAAVYGADRARVATLIAQSTLLGCISLPIWLLMIVPQG